MVKKYDDNNELCCSFCGKPQSHVRRLISGPDVYICDECVELCLELLEEKEQEDKMSYLIKDTTEEERRRIVEESLGNLSGACDGCSQRVADMYDAYIRGEMELKDTNMAFSTRYVKGAMEREPRSSCPM